MSTQITERRHTLEAERNSAAPRQCAELVVPQRHVKRVKTALEERKLLEKKRGIIRYSTATKSGIQSADELCMIISTNIVINVVDSTESGASMPAEDAYKFMFEMLDLEDIKGEIKPALYPAPLDDLAPWRKNSFLRAVEDSLEALPPELLDSLHVSVAALVSQFPSSYTIYRPMLLLPRNDYTSLCGSTFSKALLLHSPNFEPFWERIAASVGVTHIAINAGIPLQATTFDASSMDEDGTPIENIFRSPINLTPLYGFFGPPPSAQTLSSPTATNFDTALWVTQTQNGIHQTWAPLYTMFSRGNIREKTRLLNLPSVISSVAEPRGCTAVDLYAGIGYFAFSYKKAGVSKVLCWEVNPWSIEGIQRGAKLNGWRTHLIERTHPPSEAPSESTDLIIFAHSNEHALNDLAQTQRVMELPPVRHVNCGFLPSSNLSWRNAVGILDQKLGGWIHAHENVGVNNIEERKAAVVAEMERHLTFARLRAEVRCEHVEKVKTYAPGVLHVVFDIWISNIEELATS